MRLGTIFGQQTTLEEQPHNEQEREELRELKSNLSIEFYLRIKIVDPVDRWACSFVNDLGSS